jgi:hypothetical protein
MAAPALSALTRIVETTTFHLWEKPCTSDSTSAFLLIVVLACTPTVRQLESMFRTVAEYLRLRESSFGLLIDTTRADYPGFSNLIDLLGVAHSFKTNNEDLFEQFANCTTIVAPHPNMRRAINLAVQRGTVKPTQAFSHMEDALPFHSRYHCHVPSRQELVDNQFVMPTDDEIQRRYASSDMSAVEESELVDEIAKL